LLVAQSERRSPLPLGEIAPIHASVACVFAKGVHLVETRHRTF
jgi:hypothetical protein